MSDKASSTGTLTGVNTAIDISGSQAPCMFPVIYWFVGPPAKFNGGIFPTKIGLSASNLSFVNSTTVWWYFNLVSISGCVDKDIYVGEFSTSLSLRNSVELLYCYSISHSHIIIAVRCHIKNWCCTNLAWHMCTTCGTLASHSKILKSTSIW